MSNIKIRNLYKMLCYVFEGLNRKDYEKCSYENFDDVNNLYASLLAIATSSQLKLGLFKEYKEINEDLNTVRGKINMRGTISDIVLHNNKINCDYDVLTTDNIYNQILKTTLLKLVRIGKLDKTIVTKLKRELFYFSEVDEIDLDRVAWSKLKYSKSNKTYEIIINMCYLLYKSKIQGEEGQLKSIEIVSEKELYYIYENFVYRFFEKHFSDKVTVSNDQIYWDVEGDIKFLPSMFTDIVLTSKDRSKSLIIDTKYYKNPLVKNFDKNILVSNNLYQMFTYMVNFKAQYPERAISGMLLYARTDFDLDERMIMHGFNFTVKTLDLNVEFEYITEQLENIVNEFVES